MNALFPVHYTITPSSPIAHLFQVTCSIQNPDPSGQKISMPNWIPGSYMIREFAKNIVWLKAHCNAEEVPLTKLDKASWQVAACQGPLEISYEVYAWDLSVRGAHLDTSHGYFNGTSVFINIEKQQHLPCSVEIRPPAGSAYADWRVATTLPRLQAGLYEFGLYQAADYDELIDHPVEMGTFTLAGFDVAGTPHDIVITGKHRADMPRLCDDLQKVCTEHVALFGELPPMERYLFMVMAVGEGYGGLEHRSSTSLLCSRNDLPIAGQSKLTDEYRSFLGLCSHEYFHLWNVKRIKPAAFMPYDLTRETYTRQLWAFEGITSYYDDLALVRAGIINLDSYLELLGQTATRVWRGSGRLKQSISDSSFDAWTKFYKQDENAGNAIVSYYTKGALVALALDMQLRKATANHKSLDDLMRLLWQHYGKSAIGVPEGEIEKLASQLAGQDLTEFFTNSLYRTMDLPLAELVKTAGLRFNLRAARNPDDKGGKPAANGNGNQNQNLVALGARVVADPLGARLAQVFDNGAAQQAGLSAGDIVIAVDNLKVSKANLESLLATYAPGNDITIHAFRRDELYECRLILQAAPSDTVYYTLDEQAAANALNIRNSWLASHVAPKVQQVIND